MIDLECTAVASPFIMHNHRTICTNIRSNRHLLTRARTNLNLICVLCMMHMAMRHSNMIDLECTAAASPFIMHNHRTICTNIRSNRHLLTRARTNLNLICVLCMMHMAMRHSNMIDLECTAAASPFIMHNHRTICTNIHSNRHLLTRAHTSQSLL